MFIYNPGNRELNNVCTMDDIIGKKVIVNKLKNGYFTGVVLDVKEDKVKVESWENGKRWYSRNNVKLKPGTGN
jgi:hypothetical protein